jgi:hypothetical protein
VVVVLLQEIQVLVVVVDILMQMVETVDRA